MPFRPDPSFDLKPYGGTSGNLEERLRQIGASFSYPPTPDLAGRVRKNLEKQVRGQSRRKSGRLAYTLTIVLILILAALLVSPVRAKVIDWIQIGAARIFPTVATVTPPAATPVQSVLDLAGETSLPAAQQQLDFNVSLPAWPEDLGQPDHVYIQHWDTTVIVLVWMVPEQPEQVRLSLTEGSSDEVIFHKYTRGTVMNTRVNGQPAVWIDGEYVLVMGDGDAAMTRLVDQGHTLIWTRADLTYRLETDVDLDSAIRIAESIR